MHIPSYHDLLHYNTLHLAFLKVKANKGMAGADNITIDNFDNNLELGLLLLLDELKNNRFKATPFHRLVMKKTGKKDRVLMIPTVRDRIVHTAIAMILQPRFEPEFERCSFGYRPNRSYKMAIGQIIQYRDEGYQWLVDADITQFFDNIPHSYLLRIVNKYVPCEQLQALIVECLFSNQIVDNKLIYGNAKGVGIPQGSSLSPLLSNVYLDELDEALLKENMKLVRYADDFVILTNTKAQAQHALDKTERILSELALNLNSQKTQITHFSEGFSFLGHTFINELVVDEKSQAAYEAKDNSAAYNIDHVQDNELALLTANTTKDSMLLDEEQISETSSLATEIFDQSEWHNTENATSHKSLGVILNTKLRTLYITSQGAVLSKKANRLIVTKTNKQLNSIPLNTLDGIILFGRVQLTSNIMVFCLNHNMPVIFASRTGSFHGLLDNYNHYQETLLRQQMIHTNSLGKQLILARYFLDAKFTNSLVIVKRMMRKRQLSPKQTDQLRAFSENVRRYKNRITKEKSLNAILGIEGVVAKQYFSLLQTLFDASWEFTHRNRQPPKDPINVLLSLGYTILFNNVYSLLKMQKLNPSFGYLHHGGDEQPSLVLDLMEQFRATIVDATVYKLINKGHITLKHFTKTLHSCTLNQEGFVIFLNAIEKKLQSKISHPSTAHICDYRRIIEIQIAALKQTIKDNSDSYKAFTIR